MSSNVYCRIMAANLTSCIKESISLDGNWATGQILYHPLDLGEDNNRIMEVCMLYADKVKCFSIR